jgi:hypothetical protein
LHAHGLSESRSWTTPASDEVASHINNPLQGDRGHQSRDRDVQFADLAARYPFGFAAFDNAAVRHATPEDALFMVFGK